jgi:hypothetical protein
VSCGQRSVAKRSAAEQALSRCNCAAGERAGHVLAARYAMQVAVGVNMTARDADCG